jgi:hypothetical protein
MDWMNFCFVTFTLNVVARLNFAPYLPTVTLFYMQFTPSVIEFLNSCSVIYLTTLSVAYTTGCTI